MPDSDDGSPGDTLGLSRAAYRIRLVILAIMLISAGVGQESRDGSITQYVSFGITGVCLAYFFVTTRARGSAVDAERKRLRTEILGDATFDYMRLERRIEAEMQALRAALDDRSAQKPALVETAAAEISADVREQAESEHFALLLIEYYAFGLVQAKRNLAASLTASALGVVVLVGGVILALVRDQSEPTASIVTSLAGVLTTGIGTLFHRQASQALRHMEAQSRWMRQDMKAERDQRQAVALLRDVEDESLRARLRAGLILKFAKAQLPDTHGTA